MDVMKYGVLYICTTYYHVYITLLKQLNAPNLIDLVVCDDIPTGRELSQRLRETGLFRYVWFVQESLLPEERGKNKLDWILFQHQRRRRAIRPLLPFSVDDYQDIYIFHDGTPLGTYLTDVRKSYHLIEDSLNFYQRVRDTAQGRLLKAHTWKYWLRRLLNSGYFPLGESRYVKDIEVNENKNLQIRGKKIVELPRRELQNNLSKDGQKIVLDVFGCSVLPETGRQSALVLTEPLFADSVCDTLEVQVAIYHDVVETLRGKGLQVVIKPHPRDTANYSKLEATIWDRFFPVELLSYLPIRVFQCAVAVSSSALFSVPAKRRLFWYNGEFQKEIKKGELIK